MASPQPEGARSSRDFYPIFIGAWLLCSLFYFIQYALRSAPGVMVPELTSAWGLNALGLSSLLGLYYYTYAAFALFAGASLDRYGAKWTIPAGVACLAAGAVLFGWGSITEAQIGRLLQGAGSAFAFVGAVYLAAHGFPARYLATAIGATQMFGMLGGSAGQFAVSPLVHGVISWQDFWLYSGVVVFILAIIMFIATPAEKDRTPAGQGTLLQMFAPYKVVLTNPQSYLCGIIGGLLFLPTTIYAMIWAVPMMVESFGLAHEISGQSCRNRAVRLGDRLSPARLRRGQDRPSQAGTDRRRGGNAVVEDRRAPAWARRPSIALGHRAGAGNRVRRGDDPLHGD